LSRRETNPQDDKQKESERSHVPTYTSKYDGRNYENEMNVATPWASDGTGEIEKFSTSLKDGGCTRNHMRSIYRKSESDPRYAELMRRTSFPVW
jgi:hypothetical protein